MNKIDKLSRWKDLEQGEEIRQQPLSSMSPLERKDVLRNLLEETLETLYGKDSSVDEVREYIDLYTEHSKDPYKQECILILHGIYKDLTPNGVKLGDWDLTDPEKSHPFVRAEKQISGEPEKTIPFFVGTLRDRVFDTTSQAPA